MPVNRREPEADRRQAEHYLRVLNSSLGETDRRIVKYQCALALYDARGNAEETRRVRRTTRVEQRDRHTL